MLLDNIFITTIWRSWCWGCGDSPPPAPSTVPRIEHCHECSDEYRLRHRRKDLTMIDPRLTEHARQRAAEMGLPTKFVKGIMRDPEVVYDDPRYPVTRHAEGRKVICRTGELAVPCEEHADENGTIHRKAITVLYTYEDQWSRS